MSGIILGIHSGWAYLVLLMLIITIVKVAIGAATKGTWSQFDEWLNRLTPIAIDIQFLLGIILWILLLVQAGWNNLPLVVKLIHPIIMIIAIATTHITSRRVKSAPTDAVKYGTATLGYIIALVIVIIGVALIMGAL